MDRLPTLARLDELTDLHTAFRAFRDLVAAAYTPSFRLDLMGPDGLVLAAAYNRQRPSAPALVYVRNHTGFRLLADPEVQVRATAVLRLPTTPIASCVAVAVCA